MDRKAEVKRRTKETDIALSLGIDGAGKGDIKTGIGFLIICWKALQNMVFSI